MESRILIKCLLVSMTWSTSFQALAEVVTFKALASELVNKSPSLKISSLELEKQRSMQKAAKWALGPGLSFGSDRTVYRSNNAFNGAETTTSVSARLNLFDGFASWKQLDAADVSMSMAQNDFQGDRRLILGALANLYLSWQKAHQKLAIVQQLSSMRETMLKNIKRTVESGERSKVDHLLFENLLLQAQERASRTEIDQRQAIISIQKALSEISGSANAKLNPQDQGVFNKDYCDQSPSFATHPNVQYLSDQTSLYEVQRGSASSGYYPTVDLSLEKNVDSLSTRSTNNQEMFRLSLNWPIYTGLSTKFDRQRLGFEIQKSELRTSEVRTELALTHKENCERLQAVDDWHRKAKKIVDNYKELLLTSRLQYRNGGISALNLTDQELRLLDAELSLIDARFARQEILASQWTLHDATLDSTGI